MALQLVWFKKDLRVSDHEPLLRAAEKGAVLCVYVVEPEIISSEEFDSSHQVFINDCLEELHKRLVKLGNGLIILHDNLPQAFETLSNDVIFEKIWCHEETGNWVTYQRDLRVQKWCRSRNIDYEEIPQTGVIRRLRTRDGWSQKWHERMGKPPLDAPKHLAVPLGVSVNPASSLFKGVPSRKQLRGFGAIPSLEQLHLPPTSKPDAQRGGEGNAYHTLASFIFKRSEKYRYEMSSPVTGETACSRISPYLTYGAISMRTVYRASVIQSIQAKKDGNNTWVKSLSSFGERLIWHCHFMQKLEDEPEIEFQNMSRAYDGLRENDFREDYFDAWCNGMTGYPMIDACMRSVKQSGWLNFRMRAMLVSFGTYNLWLHWRPLAVFLARHFLDFEPGIHYPQFQMQAGTTGINDMRVYNPIKQGMDQDPEGVFIRKWVPELKNVPLEFLYQPELMPPLVQQLYGCVIGEHYPAPIVDLVESARLSKDKVAALRKSKFAQQEAEEIVIKHGSRRRSAETGGDEWG
jgi:deoxyribodipyrimidine photo-lyase